MDFEFTTEQQELRDAVRAVLEAECPPSVPRAVVDEVRERGTGSFPAATGALWKTLVGLDWPALALPEAVGGLGSSWVEQGIVLEELGRSAAPGPYPATVTQFAPAVVECGTPEQVERFVGPVAAGSATGALALDEGAGTPWSSSAYGLSVTGTVESDEVRLSGTKRFVADGATADELAVVARVEGAVRVVVVPGDAVEARPLAPVDATTPHADVVLDGVAVPVDRLLGDGSDATAGVARAVEAATTAVALTTLGASSRIFEMTVEYAKERHQFGVPIGSFQAVKHKLADLYRDRERAAALCHFAALCLAEDDPRRTPAASMAKAAAGELGHRAAKEGLQLHGGIGYTWEHDLHLFLRRAKVGDLQLGSASHHRRRVAELTMTG